MNKIIKRITKNGSVFDINDSNPCVTRRLTRQNPLYLLSTHQIIELLERQGIELVLNNDESIQIRLLEYPDSFELKPCKCGCTLDIRSSKQFSGISLSHRLEKPEQFRHNRIETNSKEQSEIF